MTLYFAITEGYYAIAKIIVNQHIRQGIGLDHFVKVRESTTEVVCYLSSRLSCSRQSACAVGMHTR